MVLDVADLLGPNRRNLAALGTVTLLVALAQFVVPDPRARYGAYLVVFAVWMGWFVATFVQWLRHADV